MGFHYDVPISLGLALSSISLLVVSWVDLRDVICVVCVCHHGRSQDASQAESETQVQWNGRREQETQVMALDKCVSASAGVATYEKFEAAPRSLSSIIHQLISTTSLPIWQLGTAQQAAPTLQEPSCAQLPT